jgi:hypothetical protein
MSSAGWGRAKLRHPKLLIMVFAIGPLRLCSLRLTRQKEKAGRREPLGCLSRSGLLYFIESMARGALFLLISAGL